MPAFNVHGAGDLARIVQAYRDAEAHILKLIAEALERGAKGTSAVYRSQYNELNRVRREADKALTAAIKTSNQEIAGLLAANWQGAAAEAVATTMPPAINIEAVNRLTLETATTLASVKTSVLRGVDDIFRDVTRVMATRGIASGETMQSRLQGALNEYAAKGLTAYTDSSGRRWTIDSYAEMALRTATNRAQNQGRAEQFEAHDIKLIQTSSHIGCSDLCLPYQGKILSLDGRVGSIKALNPATGRNVTVTITATLDDAIANGYHHPNCRHTDVAYIPGSPKPKPVKSDESHSRAEQQQRYQERQIRAWKRREAVAIDSAEASKAGAKVRYWQARQRDHLKANPWLSRQYSREQIRTGVAGRATGLPESVKLSTPATIKPQAPVKSHAQLLAEQAVPSTPVNDVLKATMEGFDPSGLKLFKATKSGANKMTVSKYTHTTQGVNLEDFYKEGFTRTAYSVNPGYASYMSELIDTRRRNNKYEGFTVNCDRVVQAAELQARGYDVKAGKAPTAVEDSRRIAGGGNVYSRDMVYEYYNETHDTVRNSYLSLALGWRTNEGKVRMFYRSRTGKTNRGRNLRTVKDMEKSVPDGARGYARGTWRQGGGHIWSWEKVDGRIEFFEFQSQKGKIDRDDYIADVKPGELEIVRMDDMIPSDEVLYTLGDPSR